MADAHMKMREPVVLGCLLCRNKEEEFLQEYVCKGKGEFVGNGRCPTLKSEGGRRIKPFTTLKRFHLEYLDQGFKASFARFPPSPI